MAFSPLPLSLEEALREVKMWRERYLARQPARTWVGLTEKEIKAALSCYRLIDAIDIARAIEAKLKEKNT